MPSINDLRHIIQEQGYDIFCISETWLNSRIDNRVVDLDDYKLFRKDRDYR
nr:unnamed protein product [Callosobruchus analis]